MQLALEDASIRIMRRFESYCCWGHIAGHSAGSSICSTSVALARDFKTFGDGQRHWT